MLKRVRDIRSEAEQAGKDDENDAEVEKRFACGMFDSRIACDGHDADIEEIDEELVAGDFLCLFGTPEKAFVEVLPHYGFLVETHGGAEFSLSGPCIFVEQFTL
jgi:hypothetical protein